jgi:hypothetical protein
MHFEFLVYAAIMASDMSGEPNYLSCQGKRTMFGDPGLILFQIKAAFITDGLLRCGVVEIGRAVTSRRRCLQCLDPISFVKSNHATRVACASLKQPVLLARR